MTLDIDVTRHGLSGASGGRSPATAAVFEERESAVRSYCRGFDAVLSSASGSELIDSRGRRYLDFLAGAGSLNYGHNDPDLKAALMQYIEADGIAHSLDLFTEAKARFLDAFARLVLAPREMAHRVQFTGPTGTNAVEAALKLARRVTGRHNVVAFTNAFHGVSLGSLAATANSHHRMAPGQFLTGITRMPYDGYLGPGIDTADLLERVLDDPSSGVDAPAAILLETVQGEGGLASASGRWLRRVATLARDHGALLIVDDIQAGCGRVGSFFSFDGFGIEPDMITLSKSLSGFGLPMSVVLVRPDVDAWRPGEHNGTFRGNAHAFVTATAALEKFWADDRLVDDVARRSASVRHALEALTRVVPAARVRGRGLMVGLDVADTRLAATIRERCVAEGVLLETCGPRDEVVKLLPPLTTPDGQLAHGLEVLGASVREALVAPATPAGR